MIMKMKNKNLNNKLRLSKINKTKKKNLVMKKIIKMKNFQCL